MVTEYSVVFSAVALPLTYLPILSSRTTPGTWATTSTGGCEHVCLVYLVIILVASVAAIPLMIVTGAGQ